MEPLFSVSLIYPGVATGEHGYFQMDPKSALMEAEST
jgi:hypothetical protein